MSEFFSHAEENPHGWGAAVFDGGRAITAKEAVSALKSRNAEDFAENMAETDLLIAHIRLATKGQVTLENTHPFVMKDSSGGEWILAHNGTIFGSDALSGYVHRQTGETDSERILMYLIDSLNGKRGIGRQDIDRQSHDSKNRRILQGAENDLTTDEKISTLEKVIRDITDDNKVNLLISDGRLLYAHTNYRGSMMVLDRDGVVTVSTKPLRAAGSSGWEKLPVNTLMVYENGSLIYKGVPHDNEYFEDEERTRALFLDYANM